MYDFTQINNGDILGVQSNGWIASCIRLAQKLGGLGEYAPYTHCSIAYWSNGVLYSVEMDGSDNVLRPVSQHLNLGRTISVYPCPVDEQSMMHQFNKATASSITYDYLDFISIFFRLFLGINVLPESSSDMVCSSFVIKWLNWAGWNASSYFPKIPCPAEVIKIMGKSKVTLVPEEN